MNGWNKWNCNHSTCEYVEILMDSPHQSTVAIDLFISLYLISYVCINIYICLLASNFLSVYISTYQSLFFRSYPIYPILFFPILCHPFLSWLILSYYLSRHRPICPISLSILSIVCTLSIVSILSIFSIYVFVHLFVCAVSICFSIHSIWLIFAYSMVFLFISSYSS